jgi:hypothetical protein
MRERSHPQLDFDLETTATTSSPPATAAANSAAIYCLEERRAATLAKDAAVHFASILKLISHIK